LKAGNLICNFGDTSIRLYQFPNCSLTNISPPSSGSVRNIESLFPGILNIMAKFNLMKGILFFLILVPATFFAALSQSFQIGHRTISFEDPSRPNIFNQPRSIPSEIYYPAITGGDNVPVASGLFPVLVFGHGFVMSWDSYSNFWEKLVPEGYVMVFPKSESGFLPSHQEFGKDMALLADEMQMIGAISSSPFFGRIAPSTAIMGHSMGGGATYLAASAGISTLRSTVTFAAAETNPSAIALATSINLPSLLFAGKHDCVSPLAQHQQLIYDDLGTACKYLIVLDSATHCQFAEYNFNCSTGEVFVCPDTGAISRAIQHARIFEFLEPWLAGILKNDVSALNDFRSMAASSPFASTQYDCATNPLGFTGIEPLQQFELLPNPSVKKGELRLSGRADVPEDYKLKICNMEGKILYQIDIFLSGNFQKNLFLPDLPQAVFLISLEGSSGRLSRKWINLH
jgi:predicted dienelactone hydrolase